MNDKIKETLLTMIIKYKNIEDYKKLKSISSIKELNNYRKEIISNVKENYYHKSFLMEIYHEDNMIKELYKVIKDKPELHVISRYKKELNELYHDEILEIYKKEIIRSASKVYGRDEYVDLCRYFKDLYEINSTNEFVNNILDEIKPYYNTKKAFKEEIIKVLNSENKSYFIQLINNK